MREKWARSGYLLQEKPEELLPAVFEAFAVGGIDDPDQSIGLLEVVLPVGPQGLLATDVPFQRQYGRTDGARQAHRCSVCTCYHHQSKPHKPVVHVILTRRSRSS
jgi:hypothetical protein